MRLIFKIQRRKTKGLPSHRKNMMVGFMNDIFYAIFLIQIYRNLVRSIILIEERYQFNKQQMAKKIAYKPTKKISKETELRRSTRQRKQPQDDLYWRGLPNQFNWFGPELSEDEAFPKRRRKNKYDDNQDYEGGHRSSKKKIVNSNKIQALLEWRDQIEDQQLKIITDEVVTNPNTPLPNFFKQKVTKNIVNEKLQEIAQNIEALFINIQWGKPGQTIKDFQKLRIQSPKFMSKGIAFVWAPKQLVSSILQIMNKKGFFYVQNFQVINFDREKAIRDYCPSLKRNLSGTKQKIATSSEDISQTDAEIRDIIRHLDGVEPNELIIESSSPYFNSSKKTLLMFRKTSNEKVELRHQRTCDVVFDMPVNPNGKCEPQIKRYIYSMIQTLLPEALIVEYKSKNELGFKMVELWGQKGTERRGWINIVQA